MGVGYTRQSAASIVDEAIIEAEDHNAEFNQLEAAFNGSTGHSHDGTLGEGPPINLQTSVTSILPIANGGTGTSNTQTAINNFFDGTNFVRDTSLLIADADDFTKRLKFDVGGIAASTTRTVTVPDADITISSFSAGLLDSATAADWRTALELTVGTFTQPYDEDLTAIAALNSTGFPARTAANTWALRIISGTTGQVTVTNGNGISGNPTISLPSTVTITGTMNAGSFATTGTVTGGAASFTSLTSTGTVSGTHVGNGSGLTNLNGSNISTGTIPAERLPVTSQANWNAGTSTTETAISPAKLRSAFDLFLPAGIIVPYGGATAPEGWLLCYGQSLSRTTYANLFAAIGTRFGAPSGSTFSVPDLRGRVVAGLDNMGGSSAERLGSMPNNTTLGGVGGSDTHSLTSAQNGPHNHTGTTSTDSHNHSGTTSTNGNHTHTFAFRTQDADSEPIPGPGSGSTGSFSTNAAGSHNHTFTTSTDSHNHSFTTSTSGSGSPHNNVQPTMVLNYIIKI